MPCLKAPLGRGGGGGGGGGGETALPMPNFTSEVIEEECTKGGVVGTYLLNDVDGGTMSRESQQQWEGRWTCGGGEGGGRGRHSREGGGREQSVLSVP